MVAGSRCNSKVWFGNVFPSERDVPRLESDLANVGNDSTKHRGFEVWLGDLDQNRSAECQIKQVDKASFQID